MRGNGIVSAVAEWDLVLNRILNSLTGALQSSGVDLSQASISVQVNVGKRSNSERISIASNSKVCFILQLYYCYHHCFEKSIWGYLLY